MNVIGAGFLPCGACRAYVPRACVHWRPAPSLKALKERERRARARARLAEARKERKELLRSLGVTWCPGTMVPGHPAACGDREEHEEHSLKEEK